MTDWPETDALLERFRAWLGQVREESQTAATNLPQSHPESATAEAAEGAASELGLIDLVREFTALRHEVKLQTKSWPGAGRADRRGRCRDGGGRPAVPRRAAPRGRGSPPGGLALDRIAGRSRRGPRTGPGRGGVGPRAAGTSRRPLFPGISPTWMRPSPAWKRWLCRSWHAAVRDLCQADAEDRKRVVDALAEGYAMVRKRLAAGDGQRRSVPHGQRRPAGRSARHDRDRGGR